MSSTHVSIAIPLCNSGLDGISTSRWVWNLVQSVRQKSERSGGCCKDDRHALPMISRRWSQLSAENEVRCTGEERFLVIAIGC